MSNQKTPHSKRRIRRSDGNPGRGLFLEEKDTKEKSKLKSFINKVIHKDENTEPEIVGRRKAYKKQINQSREGLSRKDFRPIHVFESEEEGESEKRKNRTKRNLITAILLGASIVVFILAVIGSVFLFRDGKKSSEITADAMDALPSQNRVTIYLDDNAIEVFTDATTVGEVFFENEITVSSQQKSSHVDEDAIHDNMEIFISTPMNVSVVQNEIVNSVTMYGGRVSDVFEVLEINLDDYDIVVPNAETLVVDQMKITFTDVEIKEISVVEDLPYETEEGETSTVESGYYHVEQDGENGAVEIKYEVKLLNGVEQSRQEVSRETITLPKNRIILWGTATPSSNSSSDSGDYDDITVKNPGEQAANPSVPAAPSDYMEIMSGHVTAYTHTGSTTATGTWPRSTRTLDNPGSCAVVPSTIPYGSLLYVTGYGYCIAEDTGGFRHDPDRWNQIDLFMNTRDECMIWGRRYDVKVYILRKGY